MRSIRNPQPEIRVPIPAFPGAEGFGAYAQGGRSGKVYHVTTLEDEGPGSLREAAEEAVHDAFGRLLALNYQPDELPEPVGQVVRRHVGSRRLENIDKVTTARGVTYDVDVEERDRDIEYLFAEDGSLLRGRDD